MEATIEELVENLIEERNLDGKEANEISVALEMASKNIETGRISGFVKTIRERIDAPTSEIFTQNGLNLNELKNVAEVVANVVIKEQIEYSFKRENENSEIQEIVIEEKSNNSTEEQFKELIEGYRNNLDKIYVDLLGIEPEDIPEEFREELAEGIAKRAKYNEELKNLIKRGKKPEDAIKILNAKYNYSEADRMIWLADQANYDFLEVQKIVESKNISIDDATKEYYKKNPERMLFYNEAIQQVFKGEKEPPQESGRLEIQQVSEDEKEPVQEGGMLEFWKNIIGDFHKQRSDKLEMKVKALDISIERYVDSAIDDDNLFERIQNKEKQHRFLKFNQKIQETLRPKKNNEIKEKRNELLKEAREKFLTGDMTASEIFDELKDIYEEYKIDAYDIIEEIEKEAKRYNEQSNADTLRKYETNIREYSITIEAYKKIRDNASKEGRIDLIKIHDKKIEILQREIDDMKLTNKSIKNTILINREKNETSIKKEVIDKGNESRNESSPKKKKGFLSFIKSAVAQFGITPKEANEEVQEIYDLQKAELEEAKTQPKAIKDNKTNSSIEVSTMNVGSEEPTAETEAPNLDDDDER